MHSNVIPMRGTATLQPAPAPDYAPPAEDHGGDWMISFVDILMLLLTLFVVLLAVSRSPKPAPKPTPVQTPVVAQAQPHPLPDIVKHTDTPPPRVPPVPVVSAPAQTPPPMAVATEEHKDAVIKPILPERAPAPPKPLPVAAAKVVPPAPVPEPVTTPKPAVPARPALTVPEDLKNQVEITPTATAVNLVIKDDVLFDAGSAQLKPSGLALLKRVAGLFADNRYPISVEGYTDDAPIHTARFPSNWELSAARATNVTRFLIAQGVTADRLSAVGYADTRPRADNATAEGRAANRRVSLVVHVKEKVKPTQLDHLAR